jgi:hypothetical protein
MTGRIFTLKSSVAGAQIINNSTAALFGVGEGDSGAFRIENAEGNFTVRTKGKLFAGIESSGGTVLRVSGGTYIYEGDGSIANISRTVVLENATFICTNDVASIFTVDGYRYNNLTATNCVFYSPNGAKLLAKGAGHTSAFASSNAANTSKFTFDNCEFVNVALTEKLTVNYKVSDVATDFHAYATYVSPVVSSEADLTLGFAGADLTGLTKAYSSKTMEGKTYKMISYYADGFALVNWGFGITENWLIGATASHANAVVDGLFGYAFDSLEVVKGDNVATATLVTYKPGIMQMNLTLQSKISLNVLLAPIFEGATVQLGDTVVTLTQYAEGKNYYIVESAIAPNVADQKVILTITYKGNTHEIPLSIGTYAETILASDAYAAAHELTYAMVEYVRVMAGNENFANVAAPVDYKAVTLTAAPSGNTGTLLNSIAFQLDGTIAIALKGDAAAISGKTVTLTLSNNRVEEATVSDTGTVLFEGLYVNEFYGDMTIEIEGETYKYSLANYLNGLTGDAAKASVQALYNYAYYAEQYVLALQEAEKAQ